METVHRGSSESLNRAVCADIEQKTDPKSGPSSSMFHARGSMVISSGPQVLPYGPPSHARQFYKMVLMGPIGMPLSIHDGKTAYPIGRTLLQAGISQDEGGMFVFSKIREAVLDEDKGSVLRPDRLSYPIAVARVLAWNSDRMQVPTQHGFKRAYAFIQVIEILPVPPLYYANLGRSPGPYMPSVSSEKMDHPEEQQHQLQANVTPTISAAPSSESSTCWWTRNSSVIEPYAADSETSKTTSKVKRLSQISLHSSVASTDRLLLDVRDMENRLKQLRGI